MLNILKMDMIDELREKLPDAKSRGKLTDFMEQVHEQIMQTNDRIKEEHDLNNKLKKKYDMAIVEVQLLRKCKTEQDGREEALFNHAQKLVEFVE